MNSAPSTTTSPEDRYDNRRRLVPACSRPSRPSMYAALVYIESPMARTIRDTTDAIILLVSSRKIIFLNDTTNESCHI